MRIGNSFTTNTAMFLSEKSLEVLLLELGRFLAELQKLEFWRRHFANHNFQFAADDVSGEYWERVPFLTKEDFLKVGLEPRLRDLREKIGKETKRFALRTTSGTTTGEPCLFVNPIGFRHESRRRTLWIEGPFMICLRGTLLHIFNNFHNKSFAFQTLVLDPAKFDATMRHAVAEFGADNIFSFPANLVKFMSAFGETDSLSSGIKFIDLSGDFLSAAQRRLIDRFFRAAELKHGYTLTEAGMVAVPCRELERRYGHSNVYHPASSNNFIVELADADESGCGEIVVTRTDTAWALLRYRTGDMGRAVREECSCGAGFTLFLAGRKNYDYVRCAGALIVRAELERVVGALSSYIAEWRAEVRERQMNGKLVGELKLIVKPTASYGLDIRRNLLPLAERISRNLFLTPNKTLANLVSEGRFLPLAIEITDGFPDAPKQILIRKIN
ncbi:MAG: hypothetical protein HY456_00530 [Parcubacteria group bacterium]|nr:hypothetical protein [Parcubacteria group bacterium]